MKKLIGFLIMVALMGCSQQPPQAQAVAQHQQPAAQPSGEPPKKICNSPEGKADITVCDFGAVISIYGNGWGNSFRKIDLVPPTPPEAPKKK